MTSRKIANHLGHAVIGMIVANLARDASPRRRLMWGFFAATADYVLDTVVSDAVVWTSQKLRRRASQSAA